jgi:hypothetical protein
MNEVTIEAGGSDEIQKHFSSDTDLHITIKKYLIFRLEGCLLDLCNPHFG